MYLWLHLCVFFLFGLDFGFGVHCTVVMGEKGWFFHDINAALWFHFAVSLFHGCSDFGPRGSREFLGSLFFVSVLFFFRDNINRVVEHGWSTIRFDLKILWDLKFTGDTDEDTGC
jgi:hypothetical protein